MKKSVKAYAAFENGSFEINSFGMPVLGKRKADLYPREDIRPVLITEIPPKKRKKK